MWSVKLCVWAHVQPPPSHSVKILGASTIISLPLHTHRLDVANLDEDALEFCKKKGITIYTVLQQERDTIYIPPGYVYAERVTNGVLIYGLRRSVFVICVSCAVCI